MEHTIDATNKILGRLAVEIALLLRGKKNAAYSPAKYSGARVVVTNTDKIKTTGKKGLQKIYRRHSGYHGGLKEERLQDMMTRDSRLVVRRAVMGMLPKNKLRDKMIKNLILFKEDQTS